jgi:hypothetical protein
MFKKIISLISILAVCTLVVLLSGANVAVVGAQQPTEESTATSTVTPTEGTAEELTAEPTEEVTEEPTAEPTEEVTEEPTAEPTEEATEEPTAEPTEEVTEEPTAEPTEEATEEPTAEPTEEATEEPTVQIPEERNEDSAVSDASGNGGDISVAASEPQYSYPLIQNTHASESAVVSVSFYNTSGGVDYTKEDTIPALSSLQYNVINYNVSNRTAAVFESDKRLVGVSVNVGATGLNADAYESQSTGATAVFLPSVHNLPLQYGLIGVQNTANTPTSVTITFIDNQNGQQHVINDTIPALSSHFYNTRDYPQLGTPDGELNFAGSVSISSNAQPIVASIIETIGDGTYSYNAFTPSQAANKVYLPNVHRFCGSQSCVGSSLGQNTWILVQNTSSTQNANITLTYYDTGDNPGFTHAINDVVPPGQAKQYQTYDNTNLPMNFRGTAVVESIGAPIVANGLEFMPIGPNAWYSYNGFGDADGATTVYTPDQHRRPLIPFNAQSSYTLVQNIGGAATRVRITYYTSNGAQVAQSSAVTVQPGFGYQFGTRDLDFTGPGESAGNFNGAGIVESLDGQKVAVTVVTLFLNDVYAYNGFGKTW